MSCCCIWEGIFNFYLQRKGSCACVLSPEQMSKRGDGGMNLTIDGKLSRKEGSERERESKKVAKREMRRGANWKEFR